MITLRSSSGSTPELELFENSINRPFGGQLAFKKDKMVRDDLAQIFRTSRLELAGDLFGVLEGLDPSHGHMRVVFLLARRDARLPQRLADSIVQVRQSFAPLGHRDEQDPGLLQTGKSARP